MPFSDNYPIFLRSRFDVTFLAAMVTACVIFVTFATICVLTFGDVGKSLILFWEIEMTHSFLSLFIVEHF